MSFISARTVKPSPISSKRFCKPQICVFKLHFFTFQISTLRRHSAVREVWLGKGTESNWFGLRRMKYLFLLPQRQLENALF